MRFVSLHLQADNVFTGDEAKLSTADPGFWSRSCHFVSILFYLLRIEMHTALHSKKKPDERNRGVGIKGRTAIAVTFDE